MFACRSMRSTQSTLSTSSTSSTSSSLPLKRVLLLVYCVLFLVVIDIDHVTSMSLDRLAIDRNEIERDDRNVSDGAIIATGSLTDNEVAANGGDIEMFVLLPENGITSNDGNQLQSELVENNGENQSINDGDMIMMETNDSGIQMLPPMPMDMPQPESEQEGGLGEGGVGGEEEFDFAKQPEIIVDNPEPVLAADSVVDVVTEAVKESELADKPSEVTTDANGDNGATNNNNIDASVGNTQNVNASEQNEIESESSADGNHLEEVVTPAEESAAAADMPSQAYDDLHLAMITESEDKTATEIADLEAVTEAVVAEKIPESEEPIRDAAEEVIPDKLPEHSAEYLVPVVDEGLEIVTNRNEIDDESKADDPVEMVDQVQATNKPEIPEIDNQTPPTDELAIENDVNAADRVEEVNNEILVATDKPETPTLSEGINVQTEEKIEENISTDAPIISVEETKTEKISEEIATQTPPPPVNAELSSDDKKPEEFVTEMNASMPELIVDDNKVESPAPAPAPQMPDEQHPMEMAKPSAPVVQPDAQLAVMSGVDNKTIMAHTDDDNVFNAQLRRYDGAQVWRIVVQNDRDKKAADELQTKFGGQLWKEVKQEVDYLLKPQVLADAAKHIRAANLSRTVLIDNLQDVIAVENPPANEIAQFQNRKGHRLTWKAYHRLEDIHGFIDYLAKTYPDICSVETIGYSVQKRPLKILKISNGNANNPGIWIDGGMHAREWISPAVVTFIANQIVEGWDDLPSYMKNINWYMHVVANPDGYEYTHTTDRLWRKNLRSHGRQCPGVDLNRNFGYKWGGKGTSANPCSQTYRGSKAFSEPETFYISKFISNFPRGTFKAYLSFHSYGQYILYPWGYDYLQTKDKAILDRVARQAATTLTKSSGVKYTVGSSATTLYPAAGGSDDWAKGFADIPYAYTIEMGDTGRYGFVLPASFIESNGRDAYSIAETITRAIVHGDSIRRRTLSKI